MSAQIVRAGLSQPPARHSTLPALRPRRGSWLLPLLCLFVLAGCATPGTPPGSNRNPGAPPSLVQTVEGISEYRLPNGLKVLLAPDAADAKVAVNLTVMAGSRHEGAGEGGMAHLLEHLIFKGSPTTPDPKVEFTRRGLAFNGTTTADRTNYFANFTANQAVLDWFVGWQADALVNSRIAKADLDSEMTVVRNEFEIGGNNPVQTLVQRVQATAYHAHSYGRPTIGNRADIEQVDIRRLQAFYKRFYRPDNAVLIVAGAFDVKQTLDSIHRAFGPLARPTEPIPQTYTLEPVQDGERAVTLRRPSPLQLLLAAYHVPPALHPDSLPLSLLMQVLADAPSGRLHKALVEAKLAQGVFAQHLSQREAGLVLVGAALGPEDEAAQRQQIILKIVEGLAQDPVRPDEFERAKTKLNKSLELAFASASAVAAGALQMEVMGDWRSVFVARERAKAVSLEDVNRVARQYLLASNRTLGHLVPTAAPQRAPEARMPDVPAYLQGYALAQQGLESVAFDFSPANLHSAVVFGPVAGNDAAVRTARLSKPVRGDLVRLRIQLRHGNEEALRNQDAPASFVGPMLLRGTNRMTQQQIQDELVRLGAALNVNVAERGGTVSLTAKQGDFGAALALTLHLLRDSTFPPSAFEELRAAQLSATAGQLQDPSARAANAWGRYGNPYPRGHTLYNHSLEEWQQELRDVTRDGVSNFHQRLLGGAGARVSLLGPGDLQVHEQTLRTALQAWRAPVAYARVSQPMHQPPPARLVYDTPGQSNANLRAYVNVPVQAQGMPSDYFSLQLASHIMGGGPGSRLWARLREGAGLSYDVGVGFGASSYEPSGTLSFTAQAAPGNVGAAEKALQEELARSLKDGFTAGELETAKRQFLSERLRARTGDDWAMTFMDSQLEFGFPPGERERNDALVQALTLEQVNGAWRKYLQPERLVWGIFGDQAKLK